MTDLLDRIRALHQNGGAEAGLEVLAALQTESDPERLAVAGRLLARVSADLLVGFDRLRPLRIAVVGTFTTDRVSPLLRVELLRAGIAPELLVTGFDQLAVQLTDPCSELARFAPDVTLCLLHDGWFLQGDRDPSDMTATAEVLRHRLDDLAGAVRAFVERAGSTVALHTVPLNWTESAAVLAYRNKAKLGRCWRELNIELLRLGEAELPVYTLDFEASLAREPGPLRDERLYRFAGMAWTPAVENAYAGQAARFCRTVAGLSRKILALDLDNTLWGGTVGDDGPAGVQLGPVYPGNAFLAAQHAALALQRQGVLLTICSKNEEGVVDDLLANHPEQVLRQKHFVARAVDWAPKDGNLRRLAGSLDLRLDSVVFADDSAFECDLVRRSLPEVTVVAMSGDPAEHAARLLDGGRFDVLSTTATDRARTDNYLARTRRTAAQAAATSIEDHLLGLGLRLAVRPADKYTLPRLIQLGQRAHQFNMVYGGHSEADTRRLAESSSHLVLCFEVSDRFGREGVVGGLWIACDSAEWLIENFVMSCRVMARGIESAVLHHVASAAAEASATTLRGQVRPTAQNHPAQTVYPAAGFEPSDPRQDLDTFLLRLPTPTPPPGWITLE